MFATRPIAWLSGIFILFLALLSAQSFGWARASDEKVAVAKFVAERLQVWKDRMHLQDWDIRVELVRADHLEPKTLGNIRWDTDIKGATISVLAPEDYNLPYNAMRQDMEFTIVHELVHLELASLPRSEASRRIEEHAVNEIADALLRLAHDH